MRLSYRASIVIPTIGRAGLLAETLEALAGQAPKDDFEVIVVVDGEDTDTQRLAQTSRVDYALKWIFKVSNDGQAAARNLGAARACGNILVFLDDDCTPEAHWLFYHLQHHKPDAPSSVVAGKIIDTHARPAHSVLEQRFRSALNANLATMEHCWTGKQTALEEWTSVGVNVSVSRDAFLHHGGFDPNLRFVSEDMECGLRFFRAGMPFIWEEKAIVRHRSSKGLVRYHKSFQIHKGAADAYRLFSKSERSSHNRSLTLVADRNPLRRALKRAYFRSPTFWTRFASGVQRIGNITGWPPPLVELWLRLADSYYWEGVRSRTASLSMLLEQLGAPVSAVAFHSIAAAPVPRCRPYCISPDRFHCFMQMLAATKCETSALGPWIKAPRKKRAVLLTFDDGYDDFYTAAFPILQKFALPATVFVVASHIGGTNSWDQKYGFPERKLLNVQKIRELSRHRIDFGSHGATHTQLTELSDKQLREEVVDSKARLEDLLGKPVETYAYPYGQFDSRVRAFVAQAGYKAAFTVMGGINFWSDPLLARRAEIHGSDTITDFMIKVRTGMGLREMIGRFARRLLR